MTENEFKETLSYIDAYRKNRLRIADLVLNEPKLFPHLLKIAFSKEDDISFKACWVLEFVCHRRLEWLIPYLDCFTARLGEVYLDSGIRPVAKVCEMLVVKCFAKKANPLQEALTDTHLTRIAEANFDWLISDQKVAVKAYGMHTLFLLGKKYDWIHPELRLVLEQGFSRHSAAYKARARHLLDKLKHT